MLDQSFRELMKPQLEWSDGMLCITAGEGQCVRITVEQWPMLCEAGNRLLGSGSNIAPAAARTSTWAAEEDVRLRDLWDTDKSMDAIIDALDRNSGQIERRLFDLGLIASRRELRFR